MNIDKQYIEYQEQVERRNKYRTSHVLHLLLSLITFGCWLPLWLLVTISNANERQKCDARIKRMRG